MKCMQWNFLQNLETIFRITPLFWELGIRWDLQVLCKGSFFLARITPVRWTRESVMLCNTSCFKFNTWKSYLDTWAPNQGTLNASKEFAFACSDPNFTHVMSNCSKLHPLIQSLQTIIQSNQWSLSLLDSTQWNEGKMFPLFAPKQFASASWSERQEMKFLRAEKKPLLLSLSRRL